MSDDAPIVVEVVVSRAGRRRSFLLTQDTTETLNVVDALHAGADATLPAQAGILRGLANALADDVQALGRQPG